MKYIYKNKVSIQANQPELNILRIINRTEIDYMLEIRIDIKEQKVYT